MLVLSKVIFKILHFFKIVSMVTLYPFHNKASKRNFLYITCIIFNIKNELFNSSNIRFSRIRHSQKKFKQRRILWEDGKQTAGKHAAKVKNNLQLKRASDLSKVF